jgi:hypothetical protein
VRLEGLGQMKNPVNSSGIEPATFRLVAKYAHSIKIMAFPFSCISREMEELRGKSIRYEMWLLLSSTSFIYNIFYSYKYLAEE